MSDMYILQTEDHAWDWLQIYIIYYMDGTKKSASASNLGNIFFLGAKVRPLNNFMEVLGFLFSIDVSLQGPTAAAGLDSFDVFKNLKNKLSLP